MTASLAVGYLYAIFACLTNGSFLVPFKFHKIAALRIHPVIFQLYASIGIFVSSWLAAAFLPLNPSFVDGAGKSLEFVPYGFLGGVIMVLSMTFSFLATRKIGVALAQGIFGGLAIIVSYLWALLIFDEIPSEVGISVGGVILLVVGISGIAGCRDVARYVLSTAQSIAPNSQRNSQQSQSEHKSMVNRLSESLESNQIQIETSDTTQLTERFQVVTRKDYIEGIFYALLCGLLGGTTLVPLHYVQAAQNGLEFIPSFGTGVLASTPVVLIVYFWIIERQPIPRIAIDESCIAGSLSGIVWNISNILSVGAIPALGYGVAFPLVHSAILISGLWGILFFREFDDFPFAELIFFICGGFIIAGAAMISVGA